MNLKKAALTAVALAVLASATMLSAQKSNEPAIGGYCPVAYQAAKMAQRGSELAEGFEAGNGEVVHDATVAHVGWRQSRRQPDQRAAPVVASLQNQGASAVGP